MRLGILSDTHDRVPAIEAAAAAFRDAGVAQVLHAGDFVAPFALPPLQAAGAPVTAVFGNNDGERLGLKGRCDSFGWRLEPKFAVLEVGGLRVAMHHEPEPVEALAASGLYDLVVYGHTHAVDLRQTASGCWIVTPGEVCGWLTGQCTCVVFDIAARQPQLVTLPRPTA